MADEKNAVFEQIVGNTLTLQQTIPEPSKPVRAERTTKKKKRRQSGKKKYEVQVIPATKGIVLPGEIVPKKRVAAYCRVSTDDEAQSSSFELQVKHYTEYIAAHDDWTLTEIYADEGISGTQVKHREQFKKMMEDCRAGKIDLIITKSISRFSRNVVDCLTSLRELKGLSPPVEVVFEKERLTSLDDKTDMVLSLMASIAQEESRSISANIRWAIRNRMKDGTQKIVTNALLGYDTDEDGDMVIIAHEAEVVRMIYGSFCQGVHPSLIATRLNSIGAKTVYGNNWTGAAVRGILCNEKYCGDVVMQKTITTDYLTHKSKKNEGEVEKFFVPDHHDPIVTREVWNKAQEILRKTSWKRWKRRNQIRLQPVKTGRLKGFVPISALWKEVSWARLENASKKVIPIGDAFQEDIIAEVDESEVIMSENSILEGYEVVELDRCKSDSVLTLSASSFKFNKATAVELNYPPFIRVLINPTSRKLAIQSCTEKTPNAIAFGQSEGKQTYSIILKIPALQVAIRRQLPNMESGTTIALKGELHLEENTIIYDFSEGKMEAKQRRKRKPKTDEEMLKEQAEKVGDMLVK